MTRNRQRCDAKTNRISGYQGLDDFTSACTLRCDRDRGHAGPHRATLYVGPCGERVEWNEQPKAAGRSPQEGTPA